MTQQIQINRYYWLNDEQVYVRDIRQHGWIELYPEAGIPTVLITAADLRQCDCEFAGQMHHHHKNYSGRPVKANGKRVRMFKVARP